MGNRRRAGAAALLLLISGGALADTPIAERATLCETCHGRGGNSADPAVPSLAGQPSLFIANELFQLREGDRKSPVMAPIAGPLSNPDLKAFAAYFAAQPVAAPPHPATAATVAAAQQVIAQNHCTSCHGPNLAGLQQMPRLAGQQRDYLARQLRAFRAGTRRDIDGQMGQAAAGLSDQDIAVLADYLSALNSTP